MLSISAAAIKRAEERGSKHNREKDEGNSEAEKRPRLKEGKKGSAKDAAVKFIETLKP